MKKFLLVFLLFPVVLMIMGLSHSMAAQPTPSVVATYIGTLTAAAKDGLMPLTADIAMTVEAVNIVGGIAYFRGSLTVKPPIGFGIPLPITATIEGGADAHFTGDFYFS